MTRLLKGAAFTLACSSLLLTACSAPKSAQFSSASASSTGQALTGKMKLMVQDASGNVVFNDAIANSRLQLVAGKSYAINLSVTNAAPGTSYKLVTTQTNVAAGANLSLPLVLGTNQLQIPAGAQGDYSWKIVAQAADASEVDQFYIASVSCAQPTFTQSSLNPSLIQVSAGQGPNLYSYSAAGVAANANGMAPYLCAWDPTGTGIQDSAFLPCNSPLLAYVNYVGSRNVGLLVKDACFTTYSVSAPVALAASTPAMPGNVFIQGKLSNASGALVGDSRVDGVNYLATNSGGHNIVQPSYSKGTFKILSSQNYGMPSSVAFGMELDISGITDSISVSSGSGSIDASNAKIYKVTYSTDQAGDTRPLVSLSSNACTLTNQNARVQFVSGQPCSVGTTGDNNKATVEVWGHYVCNVLGASSGSVKIEGDFDGYTDIVDNCSGGGGGGGGIIPIQL